MPKLFLVLVCNIVLAYGRFVHAEDSPMQEVIKSREYSKMLHDIDTDKRNGSNENNSSSLYSMMFNDRDTGRLLTEILGKTTSFKRKDFQNSLKNDNYEFKQQYVRGKDRFTVTVLVPSPRLQEATKFNLVKNMLEFDKPNLEITFEENVPLANGIEGKFLLYGKHSCGYKVKLPKEGLLFIEDNKCQKNNDVIELAEELGIKFLIEKLE